MSKIKTEGFIRGRVKLGHFYRVGNKHTCRDGKQNNKKSTESNMTLRLQTMEAVEGLCQQGRWRELSSGKGSSLAPNKHLRLEIFI